MALRKVKIKRITPKGGTGYSVPTSNQHTGNMIYPIYKPNMMAQPELEDRTSLGPVPREQANLEAEKGETAYIPDVNGLAAHFTIGGKRHSEGGTPLNLPDDSFIYSDTSKMKLKDPEILAMFGKSGSKKYTPADIAKQYDINTYRKVLADKSVTDPIQIKTAEAMIANYNLKLGKLALIQEATKGFPQGIPAVALPYISHIAIDPSQVLPIKGPQGQEGSEEQPPSQGRYGMFMEDGGEHTYTYPYSFHGGPQDWANGGNALMQSGGSPQQSNYYTELAKQLDKANRLQATKDSTDRSNRARELKAKEEYEHTLNDQKNIIANADKYLPQLYKQFSKKNAYVGYQPPLDFESPSKIQDQIKQLEAHKNSAVEIMKRMKDIKDKQDFQGWSHNSDGSWTQPSGDEHPMISNPVQQSPTKDTKPLDYTKLSDNQLDSIINTKKAYGGPVMQAGGDPIAAAIAERERRKHATSSTKVSSAPQTTLIKPKATRAGQDKEVFQSHYLDELMKKQQDSNYETRLPSYLTDNTLSSKVKEIQSRNGNSYGVRDWWGDPALRQDFINRHKWYFKEHPDWDPSVPGNVKDFQESYNKYGREKGMSIDYFTKDNKSPWSIDDELGQMTYSAPALDPSPREPGQPIPAATKSKQPDIIPGPEPMNFHPHQYAPWFAQDVIKTAGSAADLMRINKYLPWAPPVAPNVPDPTFYDPTRELAANAEYANMATHGAGAFGDPRLYAATASAIQGQGAKAAADVLGKYNNLNVGEANRFASMKSDIMNRANEANAASATSLYDKTTAANQNYDNAKAMARQNLRQSYIDAVTNRANAQVMNSLYPNFHIDPSTGGMLDFYKGSKMRPGSTTDQSDALIENVKKLKTAFPDASTGDLLKAFTGKGAEIFGDDPARDEYLRSRREANPYGG